MKKYLLLTILTISSFFGFSQCGFNPVNHWEAVVKDNATWKYIVPNATISNWEIATYNDASWASGTGGMGFGDNDDNTVLQALHVRYTCARLLILWIQHSFIK